MTLSTIFPDKGALSISYFESTRLLKILSARLCLKQIEKALALLKLAFSICCNAFKVAHLHDKVAMPPLPIGYQGYGVDTTNRYMKNPKLELGNPKSKAY